MDCSSRQQSRETIRHGGLTFRVTRCDRDTSNKPILVQLHGFLGSGEQFRHLIPDLAKTCRPVTVDISPIATDPMDIARKRDTSPRLDTDSLVAGLRKTLVRIRDGDGAPLVLSGYSMGGRLALSLATRHPRSADGLILESTTAGITDPQQRNKRRTSDRGKAKRIRQDFEKFLDEWEQNPLFQPKPRRNRIQRNQDPEIMAKWLEDFGTGEMPPVWDRLGRIRVPVLLITGASDPKFCDLAGQIKAQLADAQHVVIREAAHRVHVDRPAEYTAALNDFLSKQTFTG